MSNLKLPLGLLALLIVVGCVLQYWYWPQLPDRPATHFDANGQPNDWMDKGTATLISTGLIAILPIFFVGISQIIRWLPTWMINLPYREYWLAPERRLGTHRWLSGWMTWFSVAINMLMVVLNHVVFIANRDNQPLSMGWFWSSLGTFLTFTVALLVIMMRRFHKPTI